MGPEIRAKCEVCREERVSFLGTSIETAAFSIRHGTAFSRTWAAYESREIRVEAVLLGEEQSIGRVFITFRRLSAIASAVFRQGIANPGNWRWRSFSNSMNRTQSGFDRVFRPIYFLGKCSQI